MLATLIRPESGNRTPLIIGSRVPIDFHPKILLLNPKGKLSEVLPFCQSEKLFS